MRNFTFEITKRIVVTVEAETAQEAMESITEDVESGEYSQSFGSAELNFVLLAQELVL